MFRAVPLLALAAVTIACGNIDPAPGELEGLSLTLVAEDLEEPAGLASPPGDERVFVLERAGRIRVVDRSGLREEPALDLTGSVNSLGEKGMTGLAFHPDFRANQRAFVVYNESSGDSLVVEYRVTGTNRRTFDLDTAEVLLRLDQDDFFHQGGFAAFGPDGMLWLTFGDGGDAGDPSDRGQDPHSLHATVVRIDVDRGSPYAIPPDNPFAAGVDGAPEVWAYGFRNPWRIAIDEPNNVVVIADVGQFSREEININSLDEPGKNHGWPIVEGDRCFRAPRCEEEAEALGLVSPALVYGRDAGCAVIGGPIYRGEAIPELDGHYFFGDHCIGWIHSLEIAGERILDEIDWTDELTAIPNLMSFGTDGRGEIHVLQRGGRVYRIDPVRG